MTMLVKSNRTDRSRIAFVCINLMLFALSFGYLLHSTYTDYRPLQELPQWKGAQPITIGKASESASGYFRRQFLLASEPNRAYLVVSGTDEATVFVNGDLVGMSRYFGAKTSEILDITGFLHRGNNLIAVAVENRASGAIPELTARLELQLPDGSRKTLLTDRDWRASGVEEYQRSRHAAWNSPEFVDLDWSPARVRLSVDSRPITPYLVPERIYQTFPEGHWIWQQSDNNLNASFLRVFQPNDDVITSAWLGVSASGQYSITLNGLSLYSYAGSLRNMELFDIGPYVKPGENRLLIHVESDVSLPKLAVNGLITTVAEEVGFSSDGRWRTLANEKNHQTASVDGTVVVMQQLRAASPDSNLTLNFKKIETPAVEILDRAKRLVVLSLMIVVATAASLLLLYLVNRSYETVPFWRDLETLVSPLLPVSVSIWILLIMSYDIRIGTQTPFQPFVLVVIVIAVALWEGIIMLERFGRRR